MTFGFPNLPEQEADALTHLASRLVYRIHSWRLYTTAHVEDQVTDILHSLIIQILC